MYCEARQKNKNFFATTWSNIRIGITKGLALIVKFRYSEKVTLFKKKSPISFNFCGLLRISEH